MQMQSAQTAHSGSSSSAVDAVLVAIKPSDVPELIAKHPVVLALLEAITERSKGRYSVPGMLHRFAKGDWLLWIVWDGEVRAIIGTELYLDVSGLKCCMIRFCTGNKRETWVHLIRDVEAYARAEGCKKIDMIARKGWAKELPDYDMTHVLLEKDLT